jgi:hypothetical protein
MDETWEDLTGAGGSHKDLLKLVLKRGAVRNEEAAAALGVDRKTVDAWAENLWGKQCIIIEGRDQTNPLYKPTESFLARIEDYKKRRAGKDMKETVASLEEDLVRLRQEKAAVESTLADRDHIIGGLQTELLAEKKARSSLEERLAALEAAGRLDTVSTPAELSAALQRERAERLKLEDLLRKRQEEFERARLGAVAPKAPASSAATAQRGQEGWRRIGQIKEKIAKAKEELEGIGGPESREVLLEEEELEALLESEADIIWQKDKPAKTQMAKEKAPSAIRKWAEAIKSLTPQAKEQTEKPKESRAQDISEAASDEEPRKKDAPPIAQEGKGSTALVRLLASKGQLDRKALAKELQLDDATLQGLIDGLIAEGMVEVKGRLFGGQDIMLRKGADAEAYIARAQSRAVREELAFLRGAGDGRPNP